MLSDELLWNLARAAANTDGGAGKLHYDCSKEWVRQFAKLLVAETADDNALSAERYRKLRAGNYSISLARSILNNTPEGIDASADALPAVGDA